MRRCHVSLAAPLRPWRLRRASTSAHRFNELLPPRISHTGAAPRRQAAAPDPERVVAAAEATSPAQVARSGASSSGRRGFRWPVRIVRISLVCVLRGVPGSHCFGRLCVIFLWASKRRLSNSARPCAAQQQSTHRRALLGILYGNPPVDPRRTRLGCLRSALRPVSLLSCHCCVRRPTQPGARRPPLRAARRGTFFRPGIAVVAPSVERVSCL